jgi:hypothetical protein
MINAVVSCHYSVHKSTTHYIKKIETKSGKCVKISSVSHHDPFFKNLESASHLWLEDETNDGLSVSGIVML